MHDGLITVGHDYVAIPLPVGGWSASDTATIDEYLRLKGWDRRGKVLVSCGMRYPLTIFGGSGQYPSLIYDGDHTLVLARHPLDVWRFYSPEVEVMRTARFKKWESEKLNGEV